MPIRPLYFLRQTLIGMRRSLLMSMIGIGIMAVALFIFGIFFLIVLNLNHIAERAESRIDLAVFLEDGLTEQEMWFVKERLIDWDLTYDVRYISPEVALERLREGWSGRTELLELAGAENPLPGSFEAQVNDPQQIEMIADQIKKWPGVESVGYGQGIIGYLLAATWAIRWAGIIFLFLTGSGVVFIVANTIRLTVHARRREIEIMKFVGATDWFIRCPFLFEGMLIGLFGSLLAAGALAYGYRASIYELGRRLPFLPLVRDIYTLLFFFAALVASGIFLGALGSMAAVKKYINV